MSTMLSRLSVIPMLCLAAFAQDGAALYQQRCAGCHDAGVNRAPAAPAMKQMSPEAVENTLVNGSMMMVGMGLTTPEIKSLATHVTGKAFGGGGIPQRAFCSAPAVLPATPLAGPHWNGWGVNAENHRFQPAAMAKLSASDTRRLKLKWAFAFPNTSRATAQPTIAGGRLFVGSAGRQVFALDASSGCIHWVFEPDFGVRTAITIGPAGSNWSIYFGDSGTNVYAVDANTGKLAWKTRVETYPGAFVTGAPKLHEGRLYVPVSSGEEVFGAAPNYECCKFRGSVVALDAASGKQIWKSYTIQEEPKPVRKNSAGTQMWGPSGAGVWSSPTIDVKRRAVYVATGDSYSDPAARTSDAFLAFDLASGKLLWSRQFTAGDAFNVACHSPSPANCPQAPGPDHDFASSPILVTLANGKRALVAGQKSGMVHAVDPDQGGELLWQTRVSEGGWMGGVQWGSAVDDRNVYVAVSDFTTKPVDKPGPDTQAGIMGHVAIDSKKGGGLFALRLADGKRVWTTPHPGCTKRGCSPAQSAAVTMIPGVIFSGGVDGHLRAYAAADGKIIWDVDTAQGYETVNGVKGSGGSIDGPGPVVVNGMVYVNSGYALLGGAPGNVLLAYSVDGK
jgi:polyvinyl alcohol dehydrogenase (cytochrome)